MPRLILKPERDVDFYVEWSTIVESVTALGTRAQLTVRLDRERAGHPSRFDRADQHGSSAAGDHVGYLGWKHATFIVAEPLGEQRLMPRSNLRAFAEAVNAGDVDAARALTDPIEDAS